MAKLSLKSIAQSMRKIDICMMVTQIGRNELNSRPMSNNKDVTYNGSSYFFTFEKTRKIKELKKNPAVILNYEGAKDMFISITGRARLIRSKKSFEEHWVPDLEQWFRKGIDTPGLVLIHIKGKKLRYWQREKEGEIRLKG